MVPVNHRGEGQAQANIEQVGCVRVSVVEVACSSLAFGIKGLFLVKFGGNWGGSRGLSFL